MSRFHKLATSAVAGLMIAGAFAAPAVSGQLGLGREALPQEVAAWDIDVRPDGQGLPPGKGTVAQGEEKFAEQCAACHGDFGEGVDRWPALAGGRDTLKSDNPVKTVGSYWPFLSTVFDYVHRAMPFGYAQSLSNNEVYALTAYILYLNDVVDDDFELSKENFTEVKMPNEANFFDDPRPDTALVTQKEPCMKDCKSEVKVTGTARVLDVTPDEGEAAQVKVD